MLTYADESLKQVLDVYVECYEHCTDEAWQQRLAQTMLDIMARRPVLDLTQSYFSESYTAEIVAVQLEASLMRECLAGQMVQVILEHTSAYVSIRLCENASLLVCENASQARWCRSY
jgi:hypothetical protein